MTIDFIFNVLSAISFLAKVFFITIIAGAGPFLLIVPSIIKRSPLGIPLLLAFGLGMISLVSLYILSMNIAAKWSVHAAIAISMTSLLVTGATNLPWLVKEIKTDIAESRKWILALAINSAAVLILLIPGFSRGMTQPFRIGVDQLGYAITGQYLLDGGSLHELTSEVVRQTGIVNPNEAIRANSTCLEMNVNIACEFLLKSKRWYPATLAAMCSATGNELVANCQLLLLFTPLLLLLYCSWHMFTKYFLFPRWIALLAAWASTYNCNILNVLHEGQHAQIYAMPLLALLIFQLLEFRSGTQINSISGKIEVRQIFYTAIVMAFLMGGYSELAMVIAAITAIAVIIDIISRKLTHTFSALAFSSCLLLGMALTGPYGFSWPEFILAHVKNLQSNGGFWQPQWGLPLEIVGLIDMYNPAASVYIGRGFNQEILYEIISIVMIEIVFIFLFFKRYSIDLSVWLAPFAFTIMIFIKVYLINHIHNYQYMKAYTMLGPFLTGIFLASLSFLFNNRQANNKFIAWSAPILASIIIIGTGLRYIIHYERESKVLPIELATDKNLRSILDAEKATILCVTGNVEQMMVGAYIRFNWLNLGWSNPFLLPHNGKKILLFVLKSDLAQPEADIKTPYSIVYESPSLILLDTGETINSLEHADYFSTITKPINLDPTLIAKWSKLVTQAKLTLKP